MTDEFGIEPKGRRRVAWWAAALTLLVVVVVVAIVQDRSADPEGALLTGADFGAGYEVAVLTPDQVARTDTGLPAGIEPAQCTGLLRARPEPVTTADAVSARRDGAAYLEVVMPADGVRAWDADRLDEMVGTCATTTFDEGTVEFSRLDAPADGYAFAARVSSGDGVVTVGVAMARVGEHVVVLTGIARGDLDRREFARLARVAGEKVSAHL